MDTSGAGAVANCVQNRGIECSETRSCSETARGSCSEPPQPSTYETKAQFKLVLRVTEAPSTEDGYGQQYFDEGTMVIDIIDENDAPVFDNVAFSVGENSGDGNA